MTYKYPTFICEHCKAKVKRSRPLTHEYSMSCPKCHKPSTYYVDNEGNEHLRPPQRSMDEICEDLARLGALKNPERYGKWGWKSNKSLSATLYFTAKDGSEATVTGNAKALDAIEAIFEKAGVKYNEQIECWDEGFYESTKS